MSAHQELVPPAHRDVSPGPRRAPNKRGGAAASQTIAATNSAGARSGRSGGASPFSRGKGSGNIPAAAGGPSAPRRQGSSKKLLVDSELDAVARDDFQDDDCDLAGPVEDYALDLERQAIAPDAPLGPVSGRKGEKISLNHLLNFSFPPRERHAFSSSSSSSQPPGKKHKKSSFVPYNKEKFVHANFRFVVRDTGDYTVNMFDPDLLVNWDDIEQVIITTHTAFTCPICLSSPPRAPKLTKCGHAYCFPCVLRYLSQPKQPAAGAAPQPAPPAGAAPPVLSDEDWFRRWKKCPICYDSIYAKDLKSVCFQTLPKIAREGSEVTFQLMSRAKDNLVPLPARRGRDPPAPSSKPCSVADPIAAKFSKILAASPSYLSESVVLPEIAQLREEEQEAIGWGDQDALHFIARAVRAAQSRDAELTLQAAARPAPKRPRVPSLSQTDALGREDAAKELEPTPRDATPAADPARPAASDGAQIVATINAYRAQKERSGEYEDAFSDQELDRDQDQDQDQNQREGGSAPADAAPLDPRVAFVDAASHTEPAATAGDKPALAKSSSRRGGDARQTSTRRGDAGKAAARSGDSGFFFHQAEDGQHVYLHPISIRILKHEFGDFANFPDRFTARVLEVEESTLTDETRKRFKYLGHLPVSCDVVFCEVDLKGVVSVETLAAYRSELHERERRRRAKAQREEASTARARSPSPQLHAEDSFPSLRELMMCTDNGLYGTGADSDSAFWTPLPTAGAAQSIGGRSGNPSPQSSPSTLAGIGGSYASILAASQSSSSVDADFRLPAAAIESPGVLWPSISAAPRSGPARAPGAGPSTAPLSFSAATQAGRSPPLNPSSGAPSSGASSANAWQRKPAPAQEEAESWPSFGEASVAAAAAKKNGKKKVLMTTLSTRRY